jgi:hypothetical protein
VVVDGGATNLTVSEAPALLDSGTTLSRLSPSLVSQIADALDAQYERSSGYYMVKCSMRKTSATVDFVFDTARVSVSLADFVLDLAADTRGQYCYVGMAATTGLQILGDSVLRAGYFVFDWDNQKVHVAQAASCGEGEDIVAAGTGDDAVPSATGNCEWGEDTASTADDEDSGVERFARVSWGLLVGVVAVAVVL